MRQPIPRPAVADPEEQGFIDAVADTLDQLTGQQRNAAQLKPLPVNATLADVINAVNALIQRTS